MELQNVRPLRAASSPIAIIDMPATIMPISEAAAILTGGSDTRFTVQPHTGFNIYEHARLYMLHGSVSTVTTDTPRNIDTTTMKRLILRHLVSGGL